MQGVNINQYMQATGLNIEYLRSIHSTQAKMNIEGRLALEAIAKLENFEITEDDFNSEIEKLSEIYRMEKEELVKNIGNDKKAIENDIKVRKALEFVKEYGIEKEPEEIEKESNEKGEIIE